MSNYYEILGVSRTASSQAIRTAYRSLALQFHPDKNSDPAAKAQFQEISQAYAILGNSEKRRMYDEYGITDEPNQCEFEDILSEFFDDLGFLDMASFLAPLFGMHISKKQKTEDSGDSLDQDELAEFHRIVEDNIETVDNKFKCRVCSKQFKAREAIIKHIGNTHDDLFDEDD